MDRYIEFLRNLQAFVGCDRKTARKVVETTLAKYLSSDTFLKKLSADCRDTAVEMGVFRSKASVKKEGGDHGNESGDQ